MKVAIDKNSINYIKNFSEHDYIYAFNNKEKLEDLLALNIHCINKDNIGEVDINLTNYNIDSLKKANIKDNDWDNLPSKKDYKFAIIVPNYNNDHRRI